MTTETYLVDVVRRYSFSAAHSLTHVGPEHKCGRVHGHNFEVEIVITADGGFHGPEGDHRDEWVVDFAEVDALWKRFHEEFDHRSLNDVFEKASPTSENVACFIYRRFAEAMAAAGGPWATPQRPRLAQVSVNETGHGGAVCRGVAQLPRR